MMTFLILLIVVIAALEAPIFTIIGGLSIVCFYMVDQDFQSLQTILIEMNRLASMPVLVALPLFTLAGCILTETKAPNRIMNFMEALVGWLPGGLAIAGLCACAFFTALTGASGVTIVAVGSILYPILREKGYDEKFTLGLLTAGGSLGLLFPPSLPVILYGIVAQTDIQKIYTSALLPGVFLVVMLSIYACIRQIRINATPGAQAVAREPFSISNLKNTFIAGLWEWPIVAIVFIGIYGGFVTIAEVSALILTYIIVVECFILKEIQFFKKMPQLVVESTVLSGSIIIILGVALGFTGYLVDEEIPNQILDYLTSLSDNKYLFLIALNIFLLGVGCIMDIFSAIVIVVPIIIPIALNFGIDPIHLCIIFLVNLEIGYATPPVGINLFITSLKFNKPITLLYRAAIPFVILLLICLIVITYVPSMSLLGK